MRGTAIIHGSARRNRPFHCSVRSVYLTFYCRNSNIVWHLVLDDWWTIRGFVRFVNYNQRKRSKSASVRPYRNRDVAPLFASKESGFYFDVSKSASSVLLCTKDLRMCAYCPDCRHVAYFIIHCQWLKIKCWFSGGKAYSGPRPPPP